MSHIDDVFQKLRAAGQKALMPFLTAGDPDLEFTAAALRAAAASGATLCELGIPYSDPIADGPVIQESYTRALAKHVRIDDILKTAATVVPTLKIPVVTMVSYAIVHRIGLASYVRRAQAAGIAGAIVPDLLVEEADELAAIAKDADFSLIRLVTPTTPRDRALRIARQSTGFLYYVSVTGITGERRELPSDLLENVRWLRGESDLPICIGFGVSTPDHVRLLGPVCDGLIVGSAIVRRIATAGTRPREDVLREVGAYIAELRGALDETTATVAAT
jgi:tryptophan synthase alpha chain